MNTDEKHLVAVAREEIKAWEFNRQRPLPNGLVLAILFSFIHRVTTGRTVEETFFKTGTVQTDYEI